MSKAGRIVRYTVGSVVLGMILICLGVSLGVSGARRSHLACTSLGVTVKDSLESQFVTGDDIRGYIRQEFGNFDGMMFKDISLKQIEKVIDSKTAVRKSQAYVTKDGMLNIDITQRQPVMRFQKGGTGFYADKEGFLFPLKNSCSSHVIVIDGAVPLNISDGYKGLGMTGKEQEWVGQMLDIVNYMADSREWAGSMTQIHVEKNGDLVLIPRKGQERFIFGQPDRIAEKFELMEQYYTSIVPARGAERYTSVNVKFDRQIVCR